MEVTITEHTYSKLFKIKFISAIRAIGPILISFFCICLFLFLSFMIIEGYSVSRLMQADRNLSVYSVLEN